MADNLTLTIAAYKAGIADFNLNAPMDNDGAFDAYAAVSYGPHLDALHDWDQPARSQDEAVLALELALTEFDNNDIETAEALVRAAARFFLEHANG